jgi:hypothetical protein
MLRLLRGGGEPTLLFCGFLEETTTIDRFGVERHTLAHRIYHPGISSFFSKEIIVEGVAQPRRAQVILEIQRSTVDHGPDCRFILTQ